MNLSEQNVLIFTRLMDVGGTENVILEICDALAPHVNKVVVCAHEGEASKTLEDRGIKFYSLPDIESKNIITFLQNIFTLIQIMRKESINVVHVHHRMAAFYMQFIRHVCSFKFIATAHNVFKNRKYLTKLSYHKVRIIACGRSVESNLINDCKISATQVRVIYNAVPDFLDDELRRIDTVPYRVVSVGRLSTQKGMTFLIDAFSRVKKAIPLAELIIVGDGELRNSLEVQTRNLGLSDAIKFVGFRNDAVQIMRTSALVVLSSLWEGLPLTPIEAFSVERPVLATNVDGTAEVIQDGYNGMLVPPKESKSLAEAMISLLSNSNSLELMGKNARKTYESMFTLSRFDSEILSFYQNLEDKPN